MLLLVIDTSGKHGFVALARAGEGAESGPVEVIEEVPLVGGTFSAQLIPQISGLLAKHAFQRGDIGAFLVVTGPGSFTGLRVGLAAIKALAEILQKPIVPLSLLEVVAVASGHEGRVLAALDAGRGDFYVGEYDVGRTATALVTEELISNTDLPSRATGLMIVTTDANLADEARSQGLSAFSVPKVSAQMVAALGWKKLQAGETVSPEQLEANYIRRTDAEIFAKPSS